ncbi:MAG TPA: DoxX family protein [Allosphingosinicella sp.]|nr:DoxX family protein [Allosphingosinicella sp.]
MRDWGLPERWTGPLLSVLRIVTGLTFLEHGAQKLLGFPPAAPGSPPIIAFSMLWTGGILELVGGTLVFLGLLTRPAAFVLAGEMAVAYWTFHAPKAFFPAINGGDAAILYCFVFLYLSAAGGGPWSLDALLRSGRGSVDGR